MTNPRAAAQSPTAVGSHETTVSQEPKIVRPYIQMEEIRKAYPNPCGIYERKSGRYCVGGAFMMFFEEDSPFPTNWINFDTDGVMTKGSRFAEKLLEVNPNLSNSSQAFVERIECANDSGDFEGAWQALKDALEYGIVEK